MPKVVRLYYWNRVDNWGDSLGRILLEHLLGVVVEWAPPDRAEVVATGSVLEHLPPHWPGAVLGTGMLHQGSKPDLRSARVLALRGALTARAVGRMDVPLGDLGLLAPMLAAREEPVYNLGVVPHWSDASLAGRYPKAYVVHGTDPSWVVAEIGRCKTIVSSSLHGLIVADALGIPRRAEMFPTARREGGTFKYRDYQSALGSGFELDEWFTAPAARVEAVQAGLMEAVDGLRDLTHRPLPG